ncbi:unnamed protein product [Adineta steineri]|uniref:C2H2-type domain-containing protein n=1 Tax=Adineta steineri TaxID=433720 RepID=A0A818HFL2_9BILA|nr:unnamed protein product [Adineta steineri]
MTTSTKKNPIYAEYINPTVDQYSTQKENPLVLMAQACNNIGKEFSIPIKQTSPPSSSSSSSLFISKQRKSISPQEGKKSLKRLASSTFPISTTKKISHPQSSSTFDSLFLQYLNKIIFSSIVPCNYSTIFPTCQQSSPYLINSILSLPFVCNWIDSTNQDGFCGKRFTNHINLLEHLCTEHESIKSSYYSSTSLEKF